MQIRSIHQPVLTLAFAALLLVGCHSYEGSIYRVKDGENIQTISEKFQVSSEKLLAANPRQKKIPPKPGDRLLIPQKISRAYVPKQKGRYVPLPKIELDDPEEESVTAGPAETRPIAIATATPTKPTTQAVPKMPESKPALQMPTPNTGASKVYLQFAWPAKGKIVSTFGKKDQKMHNGIDIKIAPQGDIKASELGTVVFSGSELDGYGNLIILRHKPRIYSIYAYLGSMQAKKGDTVKKGQVIAKAGKSESTSFFHFEIRKGKQAFDPMRFLPSP